VGGGAKLSAAAADAGMAIGDAKPGYHSARHNHQHRQLAYKQFMPYGLQVLFDGSTLWKVPPDFQMTVGPTKILPLPRNCMQASEQYGSQTKACFAEAERDQVFRVPTSVIDGELFRGSISSIGLKRKLQQMGLRRTRTRPLQVFYLYRFSIG
jgi:hypothetical protein